MGLSSATRLSPNAKASVLRAPRQLLSRGSLNKRPSASKWPDSFSALTRALACSDATALDNKATSTATGSTRSSATREPRERSSSRRRCTRSAVRWSRGMCTKMAGTNASKSASEICGATQRSCTRKAPSANGPMKLPPEDAPVARTGVLFGESPSFSSTCRRARSTRWVSWNDQHVEKPLETATTRYPRLRAVCTSCRSSGKPKQVPKLEDLQPGSSQPSLPICVKKSVAW
mmetsp:Transcript_35058/g.81385  ORF Transcript_35058/g.81385 Transcript_35058/m.81385 type:complete len:232 (+) Transcript_35058:166-861(+)